MTYEASYHSCRSVDDDRHRYGSDDAEHTVSHPTQQANHDRIKGERETCRAQAQGQGLKGPAVRSAVIDCMSKVVPKVAKRMTCRQAGMAKNLSGDDLHKSVQECTKSS